MGCKGGNERKEVRERRLERRGEEGAGEEGSPKRVCVEVELHYETSPRTSGHRDVSDITVTSK